jgi:hypothetical protein
MSDPLPIEPPPAVTDERSIDPLTQEPWPRLLDTKVTHRCLKVRHGLQRAAPTLAHDRSLGVGIRWLYSGQKPVTTLAEIDRWVAEEALKPRSPLSDKARARAAKRHRPPAEELAQEAKRRTGAAKPHKKREGAR